MIVVAMVLMAVVAILAAWVVWLLRPGPKRGGMIDHSRAAARGELDWDWPGRVPDR